MSARAILASLFARGAWALGYDGAEYTRHRVNLSPGRRQSRSEDALLGYRDRERLRQECLNLRRNDPIVAGVVDRFADNVVGGGIIPQAKTGTSWDNEAEAFYREWCKIADSRQRCNMRDLQRLIVTGRMLTGDLGFILTDGGQLQPIEGERICTPDSKRDDPSVVDGIVVDRATGIAKQYYVWDRSANGGIDTSTTNFNLIPAANFVFVASPFRFDQLRGIPDLSPVINPLRDMHEFVQATLEKARLDAHTGLVVTTDDNRIGPGNLGSRLSSGSGGNGVPQYERFESGQIYYLKPHEDVKSLASNTPNAQYDPFCKSHLRRIGAALGLPYEFLLLDFSEGNYSASRAALLQTYRTFTGWQEWLTARFNQRVWNWRIAKAMKAGDIAKAPVVDGVSQWYKVEWSFPEFGWIDPQNEAQANLLEWQLSTNTVTAMNRKKGRDVEDVMAEKGKEIAIAERTAREVNAQHPGMELTWRDIISAQIPGQMTPTQGKVDPASKKEQA